MFDLPGKKENKLYCFDNTHITCFKVHLAPKVFSLKRIHLLFAAIGRKMFEFGWILFQSRALSVARPRFRESGAAITDDVYPGSKRNGVSVSYLYLLEKMENKTN